ncbi:MAG: hypothetical protein ABJP45_11125 [Cyclobacteriaceae bacterium]
MKYSIALLLLLYCTLAQGQEEMKMTNVKIWKILHEDIEDVQGQMGNWQFMMRQRPVMIVTDVGANRMRIMSPIVEETELKEIHQKAMLEANFDRALDAKYATYNSVVWSVFTHPMEELTVPQFKDALDQVVTLSENFGSSYTSTDLVFGGN